MMFSWEWKTANKELHPQNRRCSKAQEVGGGGGGVGSGGL